MTNSQQQWTGVVGVGGLTYDGGESLGDLVAYRRNLGKKGKKKAMQAGQ